MLHSILSSGNSILELSPPSRYNFILSIVRMNIIISAVSTFYFMLNDAIFLANQDFCTQPANMAGIPAISIPIRLSSNGLPLSLQLMAPFYDDLTLLDAAHLVEEAISFPRQSVSVDLHQRAHQSGAS